MSYLSKLAKRITMIRTIGVLAALVACSGSDGSGALPDQPSFAWGFRRPSPVAAVASVTVTPSSATIAVGATTQLTSLLKSVYGIVLTGRVVVWTSSNSAIASTSASGLVTAVAPGVATLTATADNGIKGTASVTVSAPAAQVTLTKMTMTPATASLVAGAAQPFTVSGVWSDGSTTVPAVTFSVTGGTITTAGVYTAGSAAGTFRVIATQQGGTLADTSAITITLPPPPAVTLTKMTMTPATASLLAGATQPFTVSGVWSDGSTTAPTVNFAATGGTITTGGVYTAGTTAGTFRVIATQQGGTLADTSAITITVPPPTLTKMTMAPVSVSLAMGATQTFTVSGQWSNGATTAPAVTFSATGGSITTGGVYTAGSTAGTFRVIAVQQGGTLADTSAVTITAPVPPPAGTTLLSEGFENGSLGSRGWFDATNVAVANDARPGSTGTHSLEWHWTPGLVQPQGSSRFDFTPSNSVYLSYWVKTSANWQGSGKGYHPHMFSVLTTADDHWIGPSITHLTLYDELLYLNGNLVANEMIQDALMIDATKLNVDLRGVTEQRAVAGANGRHEADDATTTIGWQLFLNGSQYTNYMSVNPKTASIPGSAKNQWHHVESYWQMNSIVGGIGQADGVIQYWVDGVQQIDRHDVYFRTGANPTMKFRTFFMGPYIGDGSPVDQYMWIDDLVVATAHP